MKIVVNILTVVLLTFLVTGCKKEAKLTPSDKPEHVKNHQVLPQGNHPYDTEILRLYQKYGTLFLYKYDSLDLYYNIDEYMGGTYDPVKNETTIYGLFDTPADEAYIGQQLDMVKDLWMKYWPDALLKSAMPHKFYLVDSFFYAYNGPGTPADNWWEMYDFYEGPDYFLVSWGSDRLNTIPATAKYNMKAKLNARFLVLAHLRGFIKPTAAFAAVTNYGAATYANHKEMGIIDWTRSGLQKDWDVYMETIVSNTFTKLNSPGNVLHPAVDKKGVIKKKYDIVIAYFQSAFGVDLQAIGNAGG